MRLFYAILPSPVCLAALHKAQQALGAHLLSASLTPRENLHLTVQYLGETDRLEDAIACLEGLKATPFSLVFEGIGRFARGEGDILWAAARPQPALDALWANLRTKLDAAGFGYDPKPLRPHITLARRAKLAPGADAARLNALLPPTETPVDSLALMHSHRVDGRLTYTRVAGESFSW